MIQVFVNICGGYQIRDIKKTKLQTSLITWLCSDKSNISSVLQKQWLFFRFVGFYTCARASASNRPSQLFGDCHLIFVVAVSLFSFFARTYVSESFCNLKLQYREFIYASTVSKFSNDTSVHYDIVVVLQNICWPTFLPLFLVQFTLTGWIFYPINV